MDINERTVYGLMHCPFYRCPTQEPFFFFFRFSYINSVVVIYNNLVIISSGDYNVKWREIAILASLCVSHRAGACRPVSERCVCFSVRASITWSTQESCRTLQKVNDEAGGLRPTSITLFFACCSTGGIVSVLRVMAKVDGGRWPRSKCPSNGLFVSARVDGRGRGRWGGRGGVTGGCPMMNSKLMCMQSIRIITDRSNLWRRRVFVLTFRSWVWWHQCCHLMVPLQSQVMISLCVLE